MKARQDKHVSKGLGLWCMYTILEKETTPTMYWDAVADMWDRIGKHHIFEFIWWLSTGSKDELADRISGSRFHGNRRPWYLANDARNQMIELGVKTDPVELVVYQPPVGCNGRVVAADQTVMCSECGVADWGDDSDRFEEAHSEWVDLNWKEGRQGGHDPGDCDPSFVGPVY